MMGTGPRTTRWPIKMLQTYHMGHYIWIATGQPVTPVIVKNFTRPSDPSPLGLPASVTLRRWGWRDTSRPPPPVIQGWGSLRPCWKKKMLRSILWGTWWTRTNVPYSRSVFTGVTSTVYTVQEFNFTASYIGLNKIFYMVLHLHLSHRKFSMCIRVC